MSDPTTTGRNQQTITDFITRWRASGAAERANYQLFLTELADLIDVEHPHPKRPVESENSYVFEKAIPTPSGTTNYIDLYKRGCFVLEAKQGADKTEKGAKPLSAAALKRTTTRKKGHGVRGTGGWDTALEKARKQAQNYARHLPPEELTNGGRPPLLIVADVGHTIDLYAEFSRSGGHYAPFPDPANYRITLDDLHDAEVRQLLQTVWTDPAALDPARRSARVTREIADRLAQLAKSLEGKHPPQEVANFLMRALFTMFAEDVGLLPSRSFANLLADLRHDVASFKPMVEHLWQTMNTGGFSVILRTQIPHFNGGLFEDVSAIPLDKEQIELLAEAAAADWRDVEPAIFGTLLERALDPVERHKLGAHYTPRAYVERLVEPTVMEPLRAEWEGVQTAALLLAEDDKTDKAVAEIDGYLQKLAETKILDPACGSGNFLYVTLAKMKELEAEVLDVRTKLGGTQMALGLEGVRITPQQFLGIEVNPRAAAIAELVIWIGYLQWHMRTNGSGNIPDPVLKAYHNIECRDAVLAWDSVEPLLDENGQPVTRWDGRTVKTHPVTGKDVPDETAQVQAVKYINPCPAEWPTADYIVGNPPFIGDKRMRESLGFGYVDALRIAYKNELSSSSDFVLYWWWKAASIIQQNNSKIFGFITTNSITQKFNRRTIDKYLNGKPKLSVIFAIPDHPWVDSVDGAAVRIAMTVVILGNRDGNLSELKKELSTSGIEVNVEFASKRGKINSDLTIGADLTTANDLNANLDLCSNGVQLSGMGFMLSHEKAAELGLGKTESLENYIRPYINGRDLMAINRDVLVIDLFGLDIEDVKTRYPEVYQHLLETVKPQRDQNNRESYRKYWWIFAEPRGKFRPAIESLDRYIATCRTAKHRIFTFFDSNTIPDAKVVAIAIGDILYLGILSSKLHTHWALNAGAYLGPTPNYNHSDCFNTFPFPDSAREQKSRIRDFATQLDSHRKRQQAQHPKLTLTDMYNVLEKLRAEEPLSDKEKVIHEQGLVSILKQIHDDLDAAVFDAYGWPHDLTDEEILERLVALNAERAAEEAAGHVRWLRPEYQAPEEYAKQQASQMALIPDEPKSTTPLPTATVVEKQPWPKALAEQAQAIRGVLADFGAAVTVEQVARAFKGKATKKRLGDVESLLDTLVALGQAAEGDGRYSAG